MVGGTGDIIRGVAANINYRWRAFAASVWRQNWKECGYSTVSKKYLSWKLTVGDYARVSDDAVLYTLGEINIGAHAVISQRVFVCR